MPKDLIRYDLLAQDALRGVVRKVLADVAKVGLPGEHHFFIAFATDYPGVRISQRLREQYPGEMTIVLQHQFWDLTVTEQAFEVGLSFNQVPERLFVPFEAITQFFDPAANFGLKFELAEKSEAPAPTPAVPQPKAAAPVAPAPKKAAPAPKGAGTEPQAVPPARPAKAASQPPRDTDAPEPPSGGGRVVSLDKFRKK